MIPLFIVAYFVFDKSPRSNDFKQKRFGVAVLIYIVSLFPGFLLGQALESVFRLDIYIASIVSLCLVVIISIAASKAIADKFLK